MHDWQLFYLHNFYVLVNGCDHGVQDIFDKLLEPINCVLCICAAMLCFVLSQCWELLKVVRKMKKVMGALRPLKAQVLLGVRGHAPPPNFFPIFSMLKHVFLHF